MKNEAKKITGIWMLMLVAIMLYSINVSAATGGQASIGRKSYTTIQKALSSVKNGQTIKIQKDVIINSSVRMKRNVKFTLDLNNHTVKKIQYDGGLFNSKIGDFDLAKGQMNVKNGTLDAWVTVQKGATLNVKNGTYSRIENWGTVNVTDGVIKGRADVGEYFQQDAYALVNYGKMTISGGKVEATVLNFKGKTTLKNGTIAYNCRYYDWGIRVCGGNVTVEGGKVKSIYEGAGETQTGLLCCEQGKVNIKGGTLDAKGITCISNKGGEVVISKGEIIGDIWNSNYNNNKIIVNGGNIVGNTYNCAYMEVNGGTLSSVRWTINCRWDSSTYISGGTFIAEQGSPFSLSGDYDEPKIFSVSRARVITKSSPGGYVFDRKRDCMKLIDKNITFIGFEALINPYTI